MPIDDVYYITGRGTVVTGRIEAGVVHVGDQAYICGGGIELATVITGVEMFRKLLDCGECGDHVGLVLRGVSKEDISKGMIISHTRNQEKQNYRKNSSCHAAADLDAEDATHKEPSDEEEEYMDEVKACMEEDGEISKGERRLLEKLRIKRGISQKRAAELEASLSNPTLTDAEQEYLDEYRECLDEDGEISAGERRLLNRLRSKLGISEARASELEQIG